jgi:ABC-type transport system involved in cytochrome c biogenesis permease subunit
MTWDIFIFFAAGAIIFWVAGSLLPYSRKNAGTKIPATLSLIGSGIFLAYIIGLWISLGRPPMRTIGETRLWYSLFLSLIGAVIFIAFHYKWIMSFTTLLAVVFACINIFKPEIHSQYLMPALRSIWFVPHVIVYMIAYAMMGVATIFAIYLWMRDSKGLTVEKKDSDACDTIVRIGFAFLTMGIVMGALWAKAAWGDYWTWDPKETWAAVTWMAYLLYLHLRHHVKDQQYCYALLIFAFILLQMCWWGVNYLPSAGTSIHVY